MDLNTQPLNPYLAKNYFEDFIIQTVKDSASLLNKVLNVEVSDTTGAAQRDSACYQIKKPGN